jgi:predicted nucleic acid-binding protein
MTSVVVDTDVVSFFFKNHSIAALYDADIAGRTPILSFMTIAELERWVLQAGWNDARKRRLEQYLDPFVGMPYTKALCVKWAEITVAAQAAGHRIECADAWIAATALLYGAPLVTHNRGDYRGVPGLIVISHRPEVDR